jgi:hypothetical protein
MVGGDGGEWRREGGRWGVWRNGLLYLEREAAGRKKQQCKEREGRRRRGALTAVGEGREWWWGHVTWHVPPA